MVKCHASVLFSLSHKSHGRFLNKIIFRKASRPRVNIDISKEAYCKHLAQLLLGGAGAQH